MKPAEGAEPGMGADAVMEHMREETRRAVLGAMRPAHELAAMAGRGADEMRRDLERWKAEGRIFSVEYNGAECFPPFALDLGVGCRPYPAVGDAMRMLAASSWGSAWALASWFVGLNSFLDDQRPTDLSCAC